LEGGPPSFPRDSSCPVVLGIMSGTAVPFAYGAITHYGGPFQGPSTRNDWPPCGSWSPHCHVPQPPKGIRLQPTKPPGFGLCPFRSPLLRASHLLSLPQGTEMFQFPRFPPPGTIPGGDQAYCNLAGFPHSGTPGSARWTARPGLSRPCRALHRLLAPRHPPWALYTFPTSGPIACSLIPLLTCNPSHSGDIRFPPSTQKSGRRVLPRPRVAHIRDPFLYVLLSRYIPHSTHHPPIPSSPMSATP
jgi:hypothetical protein